MEINEYYTSDQIESLNKQRPKNESEKRFVLSTEEFSRERLNAVKNEVVEMQQKYPEVLSLCMYGSMVKGTAHEGSDIDGYLFIDSELASERAGLSEEEILEKYSYDNQMYLTKDVAEKYSTEFREGLKQKVNLKDEDVEHIRSRPISKKVIDDEIETLLRYYRELEKHEVDMEKWFDSEPQRGSNIDDLLAYQKSKPKRPEYVAPSLGPMFHLDVGNGIKKYRKLFIEKLNQLGIEGEKIWEDTIRGTEMLENNLSLDEDKHYPRSLKDATKIYS
jgi:predicted nucleotidyltransferase